MSRLDILHLILSVAIKASTIFVKNAESQKHAESIITLVNDVVLPVLDNVVTQQTTTKVGS